MMARTLEVLVATEVMGWPTLPRDPVDRAVECWLLSEYDALPKTVGYWTEYGVSYAWIDGLLRSPAGWWGVVERLLSHYGESLSCCRQVAGGGWQVAFGSDGESDGDDIATAVFLAALRSVGVDEERIQAALAATHHSVEEATDA